MENMLFTPFPHQKKAKKVRRSTAVTVPGHEIYKNRSAISFIYLVLLLWEHVDSCMKWRVISRGSRPQGKETLWRTKASPSPWSSLSGRTTLGKTGSNLIKEGHANTSKRLLSFPVALAWSSITSSYLSKPLAVSFARWLPSQNALLPPASLLFTVVLCRFGAFGVFVPTSLTPF